jgi:hypothetical protein
VDRTHELWRVGPNHADGAQLIAELLKHLEQKGVVQIRAGVPASSPTGGRISTFRIKTLNEHAPALGPFAVD